MAKNLIYTVYSAGAQLPIGSTAPTGSIIRRRGDCIDATGSAITIRDPGYYVVAVGATFTAAAAGNVTMTLQQDGVAIPGATFTSTITTANTEVRTGTINAVVRVMCCGNARLSLLIGGTATPTATNIAYEVVGV